MFLGLAKEAGRGVLRMPHFSPAMVWHALSFSTCVHTYIHTYIHTCMEPGLGETIMNQHFLVDIFLGVGDTHTPTLFEHISVFTTPTPS